MRVYKHVRAIERILNSKKAYAREAISHVINNERCAFFHSATNYAICFFPPKTIITHKRSRVIFSIHQVVESLARGVSLPSAESDKSRVTARDSQCEAAVARDIYISQRV